MAKISWPPATLMAPVPVTIVTCGTMQNHNAITIAWTGIINSNPAMTYISVRPSRHSHKIISETGEFVINMATSEMCRQVDQCGVYTGAKVNKLKSFGLKPVEATKVSAPLIAQSPLCLECKVKEVKKLGSHDLFLAEIVAVDVEEKYLDENGKLDLRKANLIAYSHGDYLELGRKRGSFGYSVKKKHRPQKSK